MQLQGPGVDEISFELLKSYLEHIGRPVLGQRFEDDPSPQTSRMRAPAWFSNLLPEGALRELLAARIGVHSDRDFFLLAALGGDLPGAVRIFPRDGPDGVTSKPTTPPDGLRFSLAGVQLKFSMVRDGKGVTIPAHGIDGEWIVKLPGQNFQAVVENEFSMMTWAREAGIVVPEFEMIDMARVSNLPPEVNTLGERAYAIRRFDRAHGNRIHQEDLAQVRGAYAHDFISTLVYGNLQRGLGLNFGGSREFAKMTLRKFIRLGERLGVDVTAVTKDARARTLEAWKAVRGSTVVWPPAFTKTIDEHLEGIPLFKEAA